MSTNYSIKIYRNVDDKEIAEVLCNEIKSILGSEFQKLINCESWIVNNVKFKYSDLTKVYDAALDKLKNLNNKIIEKKFMICLAKSVNVKHEIEEELGYLNEEFDEYEQILFAVSFLQGRINTIVEDLFNGKDMAYVYNAKDLPKVTKEYDNGKKYEARQVLFVDNIYCVING